MKVDEAGRVWTPRGLRDGVLDEFDRSGMPATQFAKRLGGEVSDVCFVGREARCHEQVIFYERATYTWEGGPSPQFYEEAIFYVPTFLGASYPSRSRSCAPKADKRLFFGRFRDFIPVHGMWETVCFS